MLGLKRHRWNHIFGDDGRALVVAMDHAAVFGPVEGLEKPGEVIRRVREGGADAVLTTYGIAVRFAEALGDLGLVLRVDGGSTRMAVEPGPLRLLYSVEDALRLGADAVGCMGFPGSAFEGETLPYLARLVTQAATWNVPVMAEMLPGGFENPKVTWTPQGIADAARIGGEMGADFVKTAYTGDEDSFRRVVEGVPVPVLVLGGGKADDPRELLEDVHGALRAGARGAVVGRNVWQHPAPERMAAALAALIHDGADVDEALGLL